MANSKATEAFEEGISERDHRKFVGRDDVEKFTFTGFLAAIMSALKPAVAPQNDAEVNMRRDLEPKDHTHEPDNAPRPGGFPG